MRPRALPLVPIVAGLGAEAFAVAVAFMVGALAAARRSMEKERALTRLGEYTLLRILGKGGMGVVYEARHRLLRRRAAIKLISQDVASRAALERFDREVKTTSELSHPNTIAVFDYGRTAEGAFYYVMEYIEGLSLAQLVERYGPLPPARTSHLLGQVCAALGEAHDRGFVHRDIKPANVMVGTRGGIPDFVKVLDFGLVKERGKGADLTRDDALLGTPRYMAPEAFASPETVGPAADIYAVGCLAYYLLTGAHAFEDRTDPAAIAAHLVKEPPSARLLRADLPEAFDRVVRRCLERAPEARYQSTRQLARAFEKACTTSWTTAEAAEWWSTVELPSRSEEAASPATIELRV